MPVLINRPCSVNAQNTYTCVGYHRIPPNIYKSVWDINPDEELNCFKQTLNKDWIEIKGNKSIGWGFIKIATFIRIGTGVNPERRELNFAVFIDGKNNGQWHGYPADYTRISDRISSSICSRWLADGILHKRQLSRLLKGVGL